MNSRILLTLALSLLATAVRAQDNRPNILFCIADDASYPHMGAYGTKWVKTPGFDRVAKEGILFNRAYTPNAKCAPSRACILTGRNSWQLEAAANHWCYFPAEFRVYPEVLEENGYFVGYTGKGWAPGISRDAEGKPRSLTGKAWQAKTTKPPTRAISSTDYAGNFEEFLKAQPEGQPFCFWYGGREPHRGYEFGSGMAKGGKRPAEIDKVPGCFPDNETVRKDMLDYAFEIEYFDQHLSRMLTLLEESGQLDNTLVVVTADNGMPFPHIKGQVYESSNHLPLAVMWKRGIKKPGRAVDDFVNFIDFAPTFLEVAGASWIRSGMAESPGRSLTEIFKSEKSGKVTAERDHILVGKERHDVGRPHDWGYPVRGIRKGDLLYLRNFEPSRWPGGNPETGYLNCDGSPTKTVILECRTVAEMTKYWQWAFGKRPEEELYDLSNDPDCISNLAGSASHSEIRAALAAQMTAELKAQQDPRILGNGAVFDAYPYADKGTKDFYERFMAGEKLKAGWVNPSDFEKEKLD